MQGHPFSGSRIIIQERDVALLLELQLSGFSTLKLLSNLYFGGRTEATRKRLAKLREGKYISAEVRNTLNERLFKLGKLGAEALKVRGMFNARETRTASKLSDVMLIHELGILEIKAGICSSSTGKCVEPPKFELRTNRRFLGVALLDRVQPSIIPDAYLEFFLNDAPRSPKRFFIEYDRSTESLRVLTNKLTGYLEYYRSGEFARSLGKNPIDYKRYPFRVLLVVQSMERKNNIAARLIAISPPILSIVWIATHTDVISDAAGQIWTRPMDYRLACEAAEMHKAAGLATPYEDSIRRHSIFAQ